MQNLTPITFLVLLAVLAVGSSTAPTCLHARPSPQVVPMHRLPSLYFVENKGEFEPAVAYYVRTPAGNITIRKEGIVYDLVNRVNKQGFSFRVEPVGAKKDPQIVVGGKLPTKLSYLVGNDPSKWRSSAPLYSSILYKDLYPGIDLKLDTTGNQLEYDFIVAPGVEPSAIRLAFKDVDRLQIDPQGNLSIETTVGEVKHLKPFVYQEIGGVRHAVEGAFQLSGQTVSFKLEDYDKKYALIIDPYVEFSTWLNIDTRINTIVGVEVDDRGYAYVTGNTRPAGGYRGIVSDVVLARFNPETESFDNIFIVGGTKLDYASGLAVRDTGDGTSYIYVVGETESEDWWLTEDDQLVRGQQDVFVWAIHHDGDNEFTPIYLTFLRGDASDYGNDIAVDRSGNAYITGWTTSRNFATEGAAIEKLPGYWSAYVAKLSPDGQQLVYATYVGGSLEASGDGIAVDNSGHA